MAWFLDDSELGTDSVEVEVLCCFLFDVFTEENWQQLSELYEQLPGLRYQEDVPYWYGPAGSRHYLFVSVEPPGLQIAGCLLLQDWQEWSAAFQKLVEQSTLPQYAS